MADDIRKRLPPTADPRHKYFWGLHKEYERSLEAQIEEFKKWREEHLPDAEKYVEKQLEERYPIYRYGNPAQRAEIKAQKRQRIIDEVADTPEAARFDFEKANKFYERCEQDLGELLKKLNAVRKELEQSATKTANELELSAQRLGLGGGLPPPRL